MALLGAELSLRVLLDRGFVETSRTASASSRKVEILLTKHNSRAVFRSAFNAGHLAVGREVLSAHKPLFLVFADLIVNIRVSLHFQLYSLFIIFT